MGFLAPLAISAGIGAAKGLAQGAKKPDQQQEPAPKAQEPSTTPTQAEAAERARREEFSVPQKGGSTRLAKNSMKYQALLGRKDNLTDKRGFANGTRDARKK